MASALSKACLLNELRQLAECQYILQSYHDLYIGEENYHFIEMNFDFCNGSESPFHNINFYWNEDTKILHKKLNIIKLVPNNFKETVVSVYKK